MTHRSEMRDIDYPKRLINFFEMSEDSLHNFASGIEKKGGILEVYIHPFFYSNHLGETVTNTKLRTVLPIETKIKEKILRDKETPVLIFEEEIQIYALLGHLANSKQIFYLGTKPGRAIPEGDNEIVAEKKLLALLAKAGVKDIILGGTLLLKNSYYGEIDLQGCVGEAYKILSKQFPVSIDEDLTLTEVREKKLRYIQEDQGV